MTVFRRRTRPEPLAPVERAVTGLPEPHDVEAENASNPQDLVWALGIVAAGALFCVWLFGDVETPSHSDLRDLDRMVRDGAQVMTFEEAVGRLSPVYTVNGRPYVWPYVWPEGVESVTLHRDGSVIVGGE